MVKLKTASTSLSKNDYAKLTITTKSDISKVKITNNLMMKMLLFQTMMKTVATEYLLAK